VSKIEELKAKLALANAEAAKSEDAHEERALELELELTARLGRRGRRWDVIRTTEGPCAVVRGDGLHFKKFTAAITAEDATEPERMIAARAFVLDQLHEPAREKAEELFNAAPGLVIRLQDALIALHRCEDATKLGKR